MDAEATRRAAPPPALARLDRRTAALVAVLSLEGPTSRSRLAGLLWPEVAEATARNNLSQMLRRLRLLPGLPRVGGDARLCLSGPLAPTEALALLDGHEYGDLPDLSDWLLAVRERQRTARLRELRAELEEAQQAGELRAALDLCAVLLDLDPLSEELWRLQMRLSHLHGDRAAALAAYHRCQALLRREMGLDPSPETVALAREVERGRVPVQRAAVLPLSVQRPPRLIGRDEVWQAMQRAWDEGQGILLQGEPGVGKSRLMHDFVAAHGGAVVFEGRPGDRLVPYSTHARTYRALLRAFPGLDLPPWVRRELARIVPELGEPPPPITEDSQRLRFYQAKTEVLLLAAAAGLRVVALDDLQFVDQASVEAGEHSLSALWGKAGAPLRTIHVYRSGQLAPALERRLGDLVSAGLAVRLTLTPLTAAQVMDLVGSLEVPELRGQGEAIALASGGNPLMVLETARHLLTSGDAAGQPSRLGSLLGQRLEHLSSAALNLARAAAVLGVDFGPETAAAMLDQPPLALSAAWQELEAAQVLRDAAFLHDLLAEGVLGGLPSALGALLHRRAAAALEAFTGAPARIAGHWQAGGEPRRAAPHWLAAAREAVGQFRLAEAATLFGQAASAFEAAGDTGAALGALEQQSEALLEADHGAGHEAVVARMEALAHTPEQRARAHGHRAQLQHRQQDPLAAEATARAGLDLLADTAAPELRARLLGTVALSLWSQGRLDEAAAGYAQVEVMFGELGLVSAQADTINDLALVLDYQGRRQEAARRYAQVERLFAALGQKDHRAIVLGNWGGSLLQGGRAREAVPRFLEALEVCRDLQGAPNIERRVRTQLGAALSQLGHFGEAEDHLAAALHLARAHGLPQAYAHTALADLWASLGRFREAHGALALAEAEHTRDAERLLVHLSEVRACALAGSDPAAALARAGQRLGEGGPATTRLRLRLWQARWAAPDEALATARPAIREAQALDHGGLQACAHTRAAQALLALGQAAEALDHADQACTLLRTYSTADLPWPEAEAARVAALDRLGDPAAGQARTAAQDRLLGQADAHVPPEHRAAFLALPLHRALLSGEASGPPAWHPLTDAQWTQVQELLTVTGPGTGRPRRDTRAVLDGVLWALSSGAAWHRPFPAHLPSAATCYRRYREWQASGALRAVLTRLQQQPESRALAARLLGRLDPPGP
ncbi:tetratricopeptide repeat protein (plasmid) [Deinococcus metallilatus]|uniref:DNA-binding SARP family transcriptional activator/tetratricopeptide (TPR) repeat protein n=3 Tax=Deinococcus metallilatus TaxID=1211322 RepID=A0AAJ5K1G3_9DEIO|nr:transposase [Deinococcus metallilatus]MBB5293357.1 DNA-binding SARP family transcriptional activator/tetratricopeptide (TPR) repeat protein [Deinococcus metallilatus]QBY06463.1 tetratricopeptide repeat protein [Deinococcus metallilatus]TLK32078.1 tetratricopeptide repeat protein [Deinococcus metallilatus]GMA15420.1 hypothetical protein GCM10025871_17510 [Deinococcus metallilatus]